MGLLFCSVHLLTQQLQLLLHIMARCSREKLQGALDEVWKLTREDNSNPNFVEIAEAFDVPYSTLCRLYNAGIYKAPKMGRRSLLPYEIQAALADRITNDARNGYKWTDKMIRNTSILIWQTLYGDDSSKSFPEFSRNWLRDFKRKWNLSSKLAIPLSRQRKEGLDRTPIMGFLSDIKKICQKARSRGETRVYW